MTQNNEDHDKLIGKLCAQLEPVQPCRNPYMCATTWFFMGLFSVLVIGAILSFRMDLPAKLQTPSFLGEMILILMLSFFAALSSAWLGIPDGLRKKHIIILPYLVMGVTILLAGAELLWHGIAVPDLTLHHCIIDAMVMGILPVAFIVVMMRDQRTTHPFLCALMNAIAAAAMGYLGLRLTCGNDMVGHVCIYHILPYLLFGILIGLLARRLYRW